MPSGKSLKLSSPKFNIKIRKYIIIILIDSSLKVKVITINNKKRKTALKNPKGNKNKYIYPNLFIIILIIRIEPRIFSK